MAEKITKFIIAFLISLLGCAILLVSTHQGAGIGGDATIYITAARNLLAGEGLGLINPAGEFRLLPYTPPFFPLVLAFFGLTGIDIALLANILNILFFGGLIFLLTDQLLQRCRNYAPGLMLGLTLAGSPILIPSYSWAMAEPLCCLLGFGGLIYLDSFFQNGKRANLLISALLIGLSFLTRYSSLAFVASSGLIIIFAQNRAWKERIPNVLLFGIVAGLPMLIWLIVDMRMTATVASRSSVPSNEWAGLVTSFFEKIADVILQWAIPASLAERIGNSLVWLPVAAVFGFVLLSFICCAIKQKYANIKNGQMVVSLDLFFICYFCLIMATAIFTFPPITINSRMLLPLYIALVMCISLVAGDVLDRNNLPKWFRLALMAVLIAFGLYNCLRGVRIARQNAIDGLGYNATTWKNSETVAWIKNSVSPDQLLVTNEETALLFLLNRRTWPMHEVYVSEPDAVYYAYDEGDVKESDHGRKAFQNGEALLVVFDTFEDQMRDIYGEDTQTRIDALLGELPLIFDGDDGMVFALRN